MKTAPMKKVDVFAAYLKAAYEMDALGIQPTGRKLVAIVRGGSPKDYPQGIGNNDKLAYDAAMISLGYEKGKHTKGMWRRMPPELDEVTCSDGACMLATRVPTHVIADHQVVA